MESVLDEPVPVRRGLLLEVLRDGTCPLHLRLQLGQALDSQWRCGSTSRTVCSPLAVLDMRCLGLVASGLPLAALLAVRTADREALDWSMQRAAGSVAPEPETAPERPRSLRKSPLYEEEVLKVASEDGADALHRMHDRLRVRLWIQRIGELTAGLADETVFDTAMRGFADHALRRRLETEMNDARDRMMREMRIFHEQMSLRMEEEVARARVLAEEHLVARLDEIRVDERERAQARANTRINERVQAALVVQLELRNIWVPAMCEQFDEACSLVGTVFGYVTAVGRLLATAAGCGRWLPPPPPPRPPAPAPAWQARPTRPAVVIAPRAEPLEDPEASDSEQEQPLLVPSRGEGEASWVLEWDSPL